MGKIPVFWDKEGAVFFTKPCIKSTKKNRGTVCGVTNQIAGFQIWTNQKAVFGPRDLAA